MTDHETRRSSPIDVMLEFALDDAECTEEEARANLEAEGVDVEDFVASVRAQLAEAEKKERLSWRDVALAEISERKRYPRGRYAGWSRAALETEVRRREQAGQLGMAAHRNHREFTDDDLRSLLEDEDGLEEP